MCLGIPGRVVELLPGNAGQLALVDVEGARRKINIGILDAPPAIDDWILIHMGFAMEIIDSAAALKARTGLITLGNGAIGRIRRRFVVSGVVQGVGFRPFVYATAADLSLSGSVGNDSSGVIIEVEGDLDGVERFARRLRADAPPLAIIEAVTEIELEPQGGTGFTIEASTRSEGGRTLASPDVASCGECLAELADPADRRYRHPFISCTNCGPRFTVITDLPYDRPATTMADFALCPACHAEYLNPADRRFHAQTIACHSCGPRLRFSVGAPDKQPEGHSGEAPDQMDEDALRSARRMLAAGGIVAVKGLGGYHLACDAGSPVAVAELRRRKQRGDKPFAIMVPDLETAHAMVEFGAAEEEILDGPRRPILLLPKRRPSTGSGRVRVRPEPAEGDGMRPEPVEGLAEAIAPGHPDLGILLPYTPMHVLLFGLPGDEPGPRALVMTSGNVSGEPIVTDDQEARNRLADLADGWLSHDRSIQVPCDDSVARFVAGAELPIRRSRGYAPLPLALPFAVPPLLAVGSDLKNTCALAEGGYAWLSQHLGDMDDLSTLGALTDAEQHLELLTGVRPKRVVADLHPGYRSTGWAREHAAGRPISYVQHHHAHVASVLGEHGAQIDERVIGFAFDGTGYGTDQAIWGGEVLIAGYADFERFGQLRYIGLAGGDVSVLRPYRMALAQLRQAGIPWDEAIPAVAACPPAERRVLEHQLSTGLGCVPTSSMGRLFDAIAALIGVRQVVDYEAEAAIDLESLAQSQIAKRAYAFGHHVDAAGMSIMDPAPVIRAVVNDLSAGIEVGQIAARFHAGVAHAIVSLAESARRRTGLNTVALSGGVFQNGLLLTAAKDGLSQVGFGVLSPRLLPANDGGLPLGQLLVAAARQLRSTAGSPHRSQPVPVAATIGRDERTA